MNNRGFAITTILFGIMILFMLLFVSLLGILGTYKSNLEKLVENNNGARSIAAINRYDVDNIYQYGENGRGLYCISNVGCKYVSNSEDGPIQEINFTYTGNYQIFTAAKDGYYFVETWGAQGGQYSATLGKGGYSSGYIYLSQNDKLYVYVGAAGDAVRTVKYNGGGYGGISSNKSGFSGGGATDIRYFGTTTPSSSDLSWNSSLGLNSRIMVAGGGAGGSDYVNGGAGGFGGTLIGISGSYYAGHGDQSQYGRGGAQKSGGAAGSNVYNGTGTNNAGTFGIGGSSESTSSSRGSGGGGGGYYGGGSGGATADGGYGNGGGGGSSFISGYAGVNAITSSSNRTHTNNTKHYSGKYFIDSTMTSGVNTGNGKAKITYAGTEAPTRSNTKLNNVRYVRDCINGNSVNTQNHWVELQVIKDGLNIAKGKTVTGTKEQYNNTTYAYSYIVDGLIENTTGNSGFGFSNYTGLQCVTVDLGATYNVDEISIWHYFDDDRTYKENVTSVSNNNSTWTTIISKNEAETSNGKRVNAWN